MGYILHHAIVVTGFASKSAEAYARAPEDLRTAFSEIQCNGYRSFLVCPDGGKEGDGWAGGTSDQGDAARERFKAHLRSLKIEWVEVAFGHDDGRAYVTDSQWPQPEAPRDTRWTDAEWAAEQVALARRQADAARAEARELRAERDRVAAERDRLRVDLDHLHVGTIDHDRMAALEAQLAETRADAITWKKFGRQAAERADRAASELAETRAALEAARAAVHTPSPGGTDPAPKTRLAVPALLPWACSACIDENHGLCTHEDAHLAPTRTVNPRKPPPAWCPRRAELAKAGGL